MSDLSLTLRAPLGCTHDVIRNEEVHNQRIKPLICALFVACDILQLSAETQFTAGCLLHRYYASIYENDKDDKSDTPSTYLSNYILAACLFLAAKVEEEPRRLRDVITIAHILKITTTPSTTTNNPQVQIKIQPEPPELDDDYWKSKEQMVQTEQHVLRSIQFDCFVSHPHRAIVRIIAQLFTKTNIAHIVSDACQRVNAALFSVRALDNYPVLTLACAAVALAADDTFELKEKWYEEFHVPSLMVLNAAMADLQESGNNAKTTPPI